MTMRTIPAAIPSAPPTSLTAGPAAPAVPSIDELYRLTAQNERAVVRGVDWAYRRLRAWARAELAGRSATSPPKST